MSKRVLKSAFIAMLCLVMVTSVSSIAFASDGSSAGAEIGGQVLAITDAQLTPGGRTYAPYDTLFDAMGAAASYDADSMTVTGSVDGITVTFTVGESYMTVNATPVYTDAAAFEDSATGTIYVPVRYAAQALGYVVSWDSATGQITIQSVDDLIAASGATYTIIDKYTAYEKTLTAGKSAISGTFDMTLAMSSIEGEVSAPLTVNGTLSGLTDNENAEMNIVLTANASEYAAGLYGSEEIDPQTLVILSMLDNFSMDYILNGDTGMIYMQSPVITTLMGEGSDAWLSLNLDTLTSGIPMGSLLQGAASADSFEDELSAVLKSINLGDTGGLTAMELEMINAMVSDQVLVKDGNNYMSTYTMDEDGMVITMAVTFALDGDTFSGVSVDMSTDLDGMGTMLLTASVDAAGTTNMEMGFDIPDVMTMDLNAAFSYSDTLQTPASEPAEGSTIIPLDSMLSGLTAY